VGAINIMSSAHIYVFTNINDAKHQLLSAAFYATPSSKIENNRGDKTPPMTDTALKLKNSQVTINYGNIKPSF